MHLEDRIMETLSAIRTANDHAAMRIIHSMMLEAHSRGFVDGMNIVFAGGDSSLVGSTAAKEACWQLYNANGEPK